MQTLLIARRPAKPYQIAGLRAVLASVFAHRLASPSEIVVATSDIGWVPSPLIAVTDPDQLEGSKDRRLMRITTHAITAGAVAGPFMLVSDDQMLVNTPVLPLLTFRYSRSLPSDRVTSDWDADRKRAAYEARRWVAANKPLLSPAAWLAEPHVWQPCDSAAWLECSAVCATLAHVNLFDSYAVITGQPGAIHRADHVFLRLHDYAQLAKPAAVVALCTRSAYVAVEAPQTCEQETTVTNLYEAAYELLLPHVSAAGREVLKSL